MRVFVQILVRALYLQNYGTCWLSAALWQATLPAEHAAYLLKFWHVLPTCRNSGICCLPAELLYLPTNCRTLTSVATCRNLVRAVYLQIFDMPAYRRHYTS